jgi:hypothetical protein
MSQPPDHDQSEAPRPGSERQPLGTAPLPYNQDIGQSTMGRTAPDSSELVSPPDELFIMPSGSNESARLFGNAPTVPGQRVWPIDPQQKHQPWWVLWLLLTLALVD